MKGNRFERGGPSPESPERFRVGAHTLPSERRPEQNQDVILLDKENGVFAVFDGMGGHAAGEMAAQDAKEFIAGRLKEIPDGASPQEIAEAMESILIEANKEIFEKAKTDPDQYSGMGTTASVVKVWESGDEREAVIGNVGDSRVYKLSADGHLEQITLDDGYWRNEFEDERLREIQGKLSNFTDLSELSGEEQMVWNFEHIISQALGPKEEIVPRMHTTKVRKGEKLLIVSDGLDNLTDKRKEEILSQAGGPEEAAQSMVNEARIASREDRKKNPHAKPDDMSAIVVEF
ncbi:MAG: protein phosphatase 2C domain-containing protein [Patescibacteria group bacterium]|nr:protein phosphatase 2C domain-containing protein [Patescibacteria group bacterium]